MLPIVGVLAGLLLLSGCGQAPHPATPALSGSPSALPADSPSPDSERPTVAALVGGFWSVRDAAGETSATRVRFSRISVAVFRPKGRVDHTLTAQSDHLLVQRAGWSMSLGTDDRAPWLEAADRLRQDGSGWAVLDGSGRTVAELARADAPPPARDYETDPTESPSEIDRLRQAVPGPGVQDRASSILGTWHLGDTDAALSFGRDGSWTTDTSCESGTGADGGTGRYRVLQGGLLLITEGAIAGVGCIEPSAPPSADVPAISRLYTARSYLVRDGRLTLFDRDGTALGTLRR